MNCELSGMDAPSPRGPTSTTGNALSSKKLAACHACRDRKTRCVGIPVCQYCARNNLRCSRSEEQPATPLDQWGQQIIDAIHNAKENVISAYSATATTPGQFAPTQRQNPIPEPPELSNSGLYPHSRAGSPTSGSLPHTSAVPLDPSDLATKAVFSNPEAILTWPIWRMTPDGVSSLLSEYSPPTVLKSDDSVSSSANTSIEALKRWQSNFAHRFLGSYPIVEAAQLRRLTAITAEKGPGWNSSTCLLLLTCALGVQCRPNNHASQDSPDHGQRYWNMAKRRLGWALDEDSAVSTQCFALAGLWHLHAFEPYKARKMLFLATCLARPLTSAIPAEIFRVCSVLNFKITVGLGLQVQASSDTGRSILREAPEVSRLSKIQNLEGPTNGESINFHSIHDAWTSLQSIYSQCLQFNGQISPDPTWQTLFLIFRQLSSLGLQLDNWCRILPDSLQLLMANVNASDASQSFAPPMHKEQSEDAQEGPDLFIVYREVKLLLLLPALFFILSPTLTRRLSESLCPPSLSQQLLDRITTEANACLRLAMLSIHEASRHINKRDPHESPVATSTYPRSQFRDNDIDVGIAGEPCYHVHQWLLSSCAFRHSLVLVAGLRAHAEAMKAMSSDLALCAALRMPGNSKTMLEDFAGALLVYPKGTDLWCSGRLLVHLCQNVAVE